ncbi:MAG: extracellular solute-binding protein family 3 [Rhodospirillales bacterium]|jgi:mxaJ protein|nr:extracellular solute-binding protein family 3 [Rhodospirillales bacterium]
MSSLCHSLVGALAIAAALSSAAAADPAPLRVCADPNNLPFSNQAGQGFENRIAEALAAELGTHVEYTWWAQRRGFIRNTLREGRCDLVIGVPAGYEQALTTRPYYRSRYVFVTRAGEGPAPRSLDDPVLKQKIIGVPLIGDDAANAPPAHGLARRGIIQNVRGFMVYGDYRDPAPSARIVEAVAKGEIDIALVWGPLAYFAARQPMPLDVTAIEPAALDEGLPYEFGIAMGVRRKDKELRDRIEAAIDRISPRIDAILAEYGVPRADRPQQPPS